MMNDSITTSKSRTVRLLFLIGVATVLTIGLMAIGPGERDHQGTDDHAHDHQDGDSSHETKLNEHGDMRGEERTDAHADDSDHESSPAVHLHGETDTEDDADHDEHQETVHLSARGQKLAGVGLAVIEAGHMTTTLDLVGEVGFNEDRLSRIRPRFPGIAMEVGKTVGDHVNVGDVLALIESNESLQVYRVTSLVQGTIVEKNVSLGEFVSTESTIFVVADLSTVWINCNAFGKDAERIRPGEKITFEQVGTGATTTGTVSYISPVFHPGSRSVLVRAVVANKKGIWRPGTFVRGSIDTVSAEKVPLAVRSAVQLFGDQTVLFVPQSDEDFRIVTVLLGNADDRFVEIKQGLTVGDTYVSEGAFEIKAHLITSDMDSHAGHGH